MGRVVAVIVAVGALALGACAPSHPGPTDSTPRQPGHAVPDGWHSVAFHGVSVDVPDTVTLSTGPGCSGLPPTGDLVVPVFDAGAVNCPAIVSDTPPPPPRPDTVLTVALTASGVTPGFELIAARTRTVVDPGVTVTTAGPTPTVDAVLASVRVTPRDDLGCDARIDPAVAPRPLDGDAAGLLPVPTRAITVCEYGRTDAPAAGPTASTPLWLVASRVLPDDAATALDRRLRAAPTTSDPAVTADPFGPVLRLLVRGDDGNTRVLQTLANVSPEAATDGRRTVDVGAVAGGEFPAVPTAFGGA